MGDDGSDLMTRESRAARRLGRLFRIERAGGVDRLSAEIIRRMVDRRGALFDELRRLETARRVRIPVPSPELAAALGDLAREVGQSLPLAETRVERLGAELRLSRGEGVATGLRASADGRLLGQG